jgi:phosphonate transport system substrate-binding protein
VPINVYISKNYDGLVDAMKDKKVDFAFFSALTFVDAEKRANAKPLLKKVWEEPYYYSAIITLKSSGIKKIQDLKGKRFGFVDEKSASGHLYPLVMLYKKGIDPDHFFKETKFYGTHENSVKALVNGDVDAVAVYSNDAKDKSTAWSRFAPDRVKDIKVLWTSDPIPNDPFCVRTDFYDEYPQFTLNMMAALIDYQDMPAEKNVLKNLFGVKAMAPATSRQYDPVRELADFLSQKKRE